MITYPDPVCFLPLPSYICLRPFSLLYFFPLYLYIYTILYYHYYYYYC